MPRRMKRSDWKRLHYEYGTFGAVGDWRSRRYGELVSGGMPRTEASRQADDECFMRFPPCKEGLREVVPANERQASAVSDLGSESSGSANSVSHETAFVVSESPAHLAPRGQVIVKDYAGLAKAAKGREAPHHETIMWVLRNVLFPVSEIDPESCPDPAAAFYLSMAQDTMGAVEMMRAFSKYLGADTEEERLERRKDMARATMEEIDRHLADGAPEVSEVLG